jgi:hypothetical protein
MMSKVIEKKVLSEYFERIKKGEKTYELSRKTDVDFIGEDGNVDPDKRKANDDALVEAGQKYSLTLAERLGTVATSTELDLTDFQRTVAYGTILARLGISPPFLGFGIALPVSRAVNVKAGMLGEYTEKTVEGPGADKLLVYFGAVALHISPDQYPANNQTRMRELILGKEACSQVVETLRAKTSVTAHRLSTPAVLV